MTTRTVRHDRIVLYHLPVAGILGKFQNDTGRGLREGEAQGPRNKCGGNRAEKPGTDPSRKMVDKALDL